MSPDTAQGLDEARDELRGARLAAAVRGHAVELAQQVAREAAVALAGLRRASDGRRGEACRVAVSSRNHARGRACRCAQHSAAAAAPASLAKTRSSTTAAAAGAPKSAGAP